MSSTRTRILVVVVLALGVAVVPSMSLARHEVIRAREVRPNVFRWRDSTSDSVTHLAAPHRVRWRNRSGRAHNVIFYRTPSGVSISRINLAPGETRGRRIPEAGVYRYYCSFDGDVDQGTCTGMCGRIRAH